MEALLVTNGPGELYTWAQPIMQHLRATYPTWRIQVALLPCQFASGDEASAAKRFGADAVNSPSEVLRALTLKQPLRGSHGGGGVVLSLGGNAKMALGLAQRLGYPTFRYSFVPYWSRKLSYLYVHDQKTYGRARALGAPKTRLKVIGNLVADALDSAPPAQDVSQPHIVLMFGSRDRFALHVIPFMCAVADALKSHYPQASFVAPVSRLLSDEVLRAGIAGTEARTLGGVVSQQQGNTVITPAGAQIHLVTEEVRHAHMRAATTAVTIPGTNTLELGMAAVPSVVVLPLNKPELIPLEGIGHWLSLVPFIGTHLKRRAVLLAAPHFPVSLPNAFSGETLMTELKGQISVSQTVEAVRALLDHPDERQRRQDRLRHTMPQAGAAQRLVDHMMSTLTAL